MKYIKKIFGINNQDQNSNQYQKLKESRFRTSHYRLFPWLGDASAILLIGRVVLGFFSLLTMFNYKLRKGPCAFEESVWKQDAVSLQCSSPGIDYHCVSDENNRLVELCIQHIWVDPSKCRKHITCLKRYLSLLWWLIFNRRMSDLDVFVRKFCLLSRWF